MRGNRLSVRLSAALAIIAATLLVTSTWAAAQETVLHNFNGTDGDVPTAGLIFDKNGNLYGTTSQGGTGNCYNGYGDIHCGTVFELSPIQGGGWTETVLYSFNWNGNGTDGTNPGGGLIFDAAGNLYGTTVYGGTYGYGTVFELTPAAGGTWTEKVLWSFGNGTDGANPGGGLIFDAAGNLYGTTVYGGTYGYGMVFELTPAAGGTWTEKVLWSFGNGTDGYQPFAGLIFDAAGNLYGTTVSGGTYLYNGTVFELTPAAGGGWTEQVLHSFNYNGTDGIWPYAGLIFDAAGNLYGTTDSGGAYGDGTVFELMPGQGGIWTEGVLYSFLCSPFNCTDGYSPQAGLIFDAAGNLYGTTSEGGTYHYGTVFELTPAAGGGWTETVLYSFGNGTDGVGPVAGLIFDAAGNLYGTTAYGGTGVDGLNEGGTVFELASQLVATTTALTAAPNPSNVGQAVTMTATVTAQNGSIPTGIVIFDSNGVQVGSALLNNSGVAVLIYAGLNIGTNNLTAVYQGSGTLALSTSNTVRQVVVNPLGSTTSVISSPNPSTSGQEVTITATVSPSGPPTPTGTVGFTSNGTAISGCTALSLSSSMAVCMTSTLAVGTDAIVATYSGDGNYTGSSGSTTQLVNPVPTAIQFLPLTPCRVVDTRNTDGTFGGPAIAGNLSRSFPLSQSGNPCGIPDSAVAYSLNVTVVPQTTLGYLTIWPSGEGQPYVSTMNSPDGRIKANAAIVPAGTPAGSVSVYVTNTTNVILDIDGYFTAPGSGTYQFYPLTPCRVVDTRSGSGFPPELGPPSLQAQMQRELPILSSSCLSGITNPVAYSFNVTVVPNPKGQKLGYLTVWPSDQMQPTVSTLNNPTATGVANAAIVPAAPDGDIDVYAFNSTDLIIDINGYFGAPGQNGLSLYPVAPCRVLDTRNNNGKPFMDEKTVNVVGSPCAPPASAQAYVFNATVVPPGKMPYLTLWADGQQQPVVSTLNAYDGFVTSNMAIVPTTNGSIDAYAAGLTQLILDISGYFAP